MSLKNNFDPNHIVYLKEYHPLMQLDSFRNLKIKKHNTDYRSLKENRTSKQSLSEESIEQKLIKAFSE